MKKLLSLLLAVVMLFALAAPAFAAEDGIMLISEAAPVVPADAAGSIVILHSNDVHGAVEGYAKMAALKAMYEAAGAEVYVMDAGDFSQGTTYVSVSQGATAVELMNMVGYDVVSPGNHEFDYGFENLKTLQAMASFPILAGNLAYEGGFLFGHSDYVVLTAKSGLKLGVFGLDTPETATKAHPAKIKGVTFAGGAEMYAAAQGFVDTLKAEGADVIICLGHLGIDDESAANGNRSIDLLEKVSGIDVFVDGHSHSTEDQIVAVTNEDRTVNGTVVTSTGTKFANVGVITIKDGTITTHCVDCANIPVAEDDPVLAKAKAIEDEIEALYGATFAVSKVDLNGDRAPGNRTEETNLGDLIADAMLWFATKEELSVPSENVVAITNGGGIRAPIAAGDICKNDVNTVLPFGNTVAVDYVSGAVLLEVLEASTFCTPTAVGGFPQIAGMTITVNTGEYFDKGELYPGTTYSAPNAIDRVLISSVNGKPFDPNATYAVVTNDFVAAGGDTYYSLSVSDVITDTGVPLDEALMQYITEVLGGVIPETYAAPQGRITLIDQPSWYSAAVSDVLNKGVMKSKEGGFIPLWAASRADVYEALYNIEGRPAVNNRMATFPDAMGESYEDAVRWAEQADLLIRVGAPDFRGGDNMTRGEIVTILYNYAKYKGYDVTVGEGVNLLSYVDSAEMIELAAWVVPGIQWAVGEGVIAGRGNRIDYNSNATRGELAQMLSNFCAVDFTYAVPAGGIKGAAASASKYGNVLTDITEAQMAAAGFEVGDILKVRLTNSGEELEVPFGTGYSNVDQGSNIIMINDGYLQIAINRGDFATTYGLGTKNEDSTFTMTEGAELIVSMGEKAGYLAEMEMRELDSKRTNNREDYASDEVFANFRAITMGDIADGMLYRTSSPVNPELGRNTYADALIKAAGVKTVVNLADCVNNVKEYEGYADSYYATLNTVHLNMGVDMYSDEAKADLKNGLTFMAENKGPYAFHCTEGKDRAGYFAMLLEALMGASLQDIVADYMLSFENYYFVKADTEQWSAIAASNIEKDVMKLTNTGDIFAAGDADLQACAKAYMINELGMTAEQVQALMDNLAGK